MPNIYFELTREFNREAPVAALASGQAVAYYRIAIVSKDGDWVIQETPEACEAVLAVLADHGARYRPSAPLDVRWLSGGWSSHFEFADDRGRRVRCDFMSRPPRIHPDCLPGFFEDSGSPDDLLVVDPESLVLMKQTHLARDYPIIGELARLLPPEQELAYTTDPDRILLLAPLVPCAIPRPSVEAARASEERDPVVVSLAREIDAMRQRDRARVDRYVAAAAPYLDAWRASSVSDLPLLDAHAAACALAEQWLPPSPLTQETRDAHAQ